MKDIYKVVKYFKKLRGLFIYDQLHDTALTEQTIVEYATSFWTRCDTLRKIGFYIRDPFLMAEKRVSLLFIDVCIKMTTKLLLENRSGGDWNCFVGHINIHTFM